MVVSSTLKIKHIAPALAVVSVLATYATHSDAASFLETLQTLPEGQWQRVNSNRFDDVWQAPDQSPHPSPGDVVGNSGAVRA